MKEGRPTAALVASLVLHGATLGVASVVGSWLVRDVAPAEAAPALATFGGFHGNTVETEGLVEGELGDRGDGDEEGLRAGERGDEGETGTTAPQTEPGHATEPEPTAGGEKKKPEKKLQRKRRHPTRGRRDHAAPKPTPGGGGHDGEGDGGRGEGKQVGSKTGDKGVKDLALAFTAAVPQAIYGDKLWRKLPIGDAGSVEVTLVVTDGQITRTEVPDGAPAHLRHIMERTLPLLLAGRYALPGDAGGKERLRLAAAITEVEVEETVEDGRQVLALGNDEPNNGQPGHAFFTLASGRHIVITVTVLR